ncbi:unnamed protein product, partial [Allacma fusca]
TRHPLQTCLLSKPIKLFYVCECQLSGDLQSLTNLGNVLMGYTESQTDLSAIDCTVNNNKPQKQR